MKPILAAFALAMALLPMTLGAQEATPTPNPLVYDDPAMHFQAPDGWVSPGQRQVALADLGDDPTTVAMWIKPDRDHPIKLILQQQAFSGSLDVFESTIEQQMRGDTDDGVVRGKDRISLRNGMPAYFVSVVSGSGFTTTKSFIVAWIDGQRGVALIATAQLGDLDADTARKFMSNVSAVRYPDDRE